MDRHPLTCLQSTILVGVLPNLIGMQTCHETWEVLKEHYASVSVRNTCTSTPKRV
jgi:hypothetical protein